MKSVSVAMATYNGQKHIRRQLDSLAAQTLLPSELIVADDQSEDDTMSIINSFVKNSPFPVSVIRNDTRLGYRKNFMRAASLCRSELIAFCDQDDYWYPDKIAHAVNPFSDPEVLLTYHAVDIVSEDGNRIGSLSERAPKQSILNPLSSGPWLHGAGFTEIFRRALLRFSDLWEHSLDQNCTGEPMAHDQWYFFLASVFGKIVYLDEPLATYMQHGNNTVGWQKAGFIDFVQKHFCNHSRMYFGHAEAAGRRAIILEMAEDSLEPVWAERAAIAAKRYRMVSSHYADRSTLYTSSNFGERLRAYRAVCERGGYNRGPWTLGRRYLITDAFLGVLIGCFLPPSPYWPSAGG